MAGKSTTSILSRMAELMPYPTFSHSNGRTIVKRAILLERGIARSEASMATNPPKGDGHRNGAVKNRSQTHNPKNDKWVERDRTTGRFINQKADNKPFKGVRKEK